MQNLKSHWFTKVLGGVALALAVSRCGPLAQSISKNGLGQNSSSGSGIGMPSLGTASVTAKTAAESADILVDAEAFDQTHFNQLATDWETKPSIQTIELTQAQVKEFMDVLKVDVQFPKSHLPAHLKWTVKLADLAKPIPAFELKARPKGDGRTWTFMVDINDAQADIAVLQKHSQAMTLWFSDSELPVEATQQVAIQSIKPVSAIK